MRIVIFNNEEDVADYASNYIVEAIKAFQPSETRPFVLGLPTGGTPVKTYQRLIQAFREGRVSFANVVSFNMDEYVGLPPQHPQSYHHFMKVNFFDYVDIKKENTHILSGIAPDLVRECEIYEEKIKSYGGIHLFMCGIGTDGHIAFNEPGSSLSSLTRVKSLNEETVMSNARFFGDDLRHVPTMALTVGVKTVMNAKMVLLLATGKNKARAVASCVESGISHMHPASMLQTHPSAVLCIDEAATDCLLVKTVKYFKGLLKKENELKRRQENAKVVYSSAPAKL